MKKIDKIILGIDPGTTIMGFGLIKVMNKKMELIEMDELKNIGANSLALLFDDIPEKMNETDKNVFASFAQAQGMQFHFYSFKIPHAGQLVSVGLNIAPHALQIISPSTSLNFSSFKSSGKSPIT